MELQTAKARLLSGYVEDALTTILKGLSDAETQRDSFDAALQKERAAHLATSKDNVRVRAELDKVATELRAALAIKSTDSVQLTPFGLAENVRLRLQNLEQQIVRESDTIDVELISHDGFSKRTQAIIGATIVALGGRKFRLWYGNKYREIA